MKLFRKKVNGRRSGNNSETLFSAALNEALLDTFREMGYTVQRWPREKDKNCKEEINITRAALWTGNVA